MQPELLDYKKLRPYVEVTVTAFLNEIKCRYKESKYKVINTFEATFNLNYLILSKGGNIGINQETYGINNTNNMNDLNILDYLNDKEELEKLTYDYLIKECNCNAQNSDKKGNTFFYLSPVILKEVGNLMKFQ